MFDVIIKLAMGLLCTAGLFELTLRLIFAFSNMSKRSLTPKSALISDTSLRTWLPTTGLIGKYANAAGGYDFILMDDGTSSHTFDYWVTEATVGTLREKSTGRDF